MATEVTFDPQGTPTSVTDAFYKAQDNRMSMMERAQALKNQTLAQKINETKLAQWEVEAPLRSLQLETNMAEAGTKLYATQDTLKATRDLEQNSPSFIEMMKDADVIENDEEGEPKYNDNFVKWGKVVSALSPYSNTTKGKQMLEAAKAQQMQYRMAYANVLDFKEKRLQKEAMLERMRQKPDESPATEQDIADLQEVGVDTTGIELKNTYRFKRDPATGKAIAWSQPSVINRSSEAQGDVSMYKEQGQQRAQKASEFLTDIDNMAEKGRERRMYIGQIIDLYKRGAVTGAGTSEINQIRGFLVRGGFADADSLATDEQVETALMHLVVEDRRDFGKGTGALSDGETRMFQRATANPNRLPAANLAILAFMDEAAKRSEELQEYALKLRIENPQMSDYEIHMKTLDERRKKPLQSAKKMLELSAQKANGAQRKTNSTAPVFDPASLMQQARKNIQGQ